MSLLGKFATLEVVQHSDYGVFLKMDNEQLLLPKSIGSKKYEIGEKVEVFVYRDAEGRLIATDSIPNVLVGEFGYMEAKENTSFGTFMDWGIAKDLLIPFSEQKSDLVEGRKYLVYVLIDEKTNKIIGSTKLNRFITNDELKVNPGEEVDLFIADKTDLGYKVIINAQHWGLVYENEIFKSLKSGDRMKGYIKAIREDNKIDVSLQKKGYDEVTSSVDVILQRLRANKGFLPLHDKSDPTEVYSELGISKKVFKKAIGSLYKEGRIDISDKGISLKEDEEF